MQDSTALKMVQAFPGSGQLVAFAGRLLEWLNKDLNPEGEPLSESRARALLLAGDLLDEPTRNAFAQIIENEQPARIALYDLLRESGLAENEDVAVLAATSAQAAAPDRPAPPAWLALAVAAHAWRSGFPLERLDPAAPPDPYSPAGQVLKRAAYFVRQQVQRSATERDKLGRRLGYNPAAAGTATLDTMRPEAAIPPLPPYFRPPIPVRYPEYTPAVQVEPDEVEHPPAVERGDRITISDADLEPRPMPPPATPTTQPAIRIDASQLEPPRPPETPARPSANPPGVIMPRSTAAANTAAVSEATRRKRRRHDEMKTTKLRIVAQEYPDGPGLFGLQVRVSSRGIRRYVAGTTNSNGEFTCELPVRVDSGLTYDVDLTWPRDFGSEVERKSITLNADRTHFVLPFYRTLKA